jgi:hypothetical protein
MTTSGEMRFATSPFGDAVLLARNNLQVLSIHAQRISAFVVHFVCSWNRPKRKMVSHLMPTIHPEAAILITVCGENAARTDPDMTARVGLWHIVLFEPFFKRLLHNIHSCRLNDQPTDPS